MPQDPLTTAINKLQRDFATLQFPCSEVTSDGQTELLYHWPGPADEDILITVHKSGSVQEPFHRHDYFYFNYTYKGQYDSLSFRYDHRITIRENELYAGQPFAGHALCVHDDQETIIIGVLVRRETLFLTFLPLLSTSAQLLRFFIDPTTHHHAEEFLHFQLATHDAVRTLLEMMVIEYAHKQPDTQSILKPLVLAFLMQITRQYAAACSPGDEAPLSQQIVAYMNAHIGQVSLSDLAAHFSYHPNYLSTILHKELGQTFSEILLEQRMQRAAILLRETPLSIETIAAMLGYSNKSNFHKAFRATYGQTPGTWRRVT